MALLHVAFQEGFAGDTAVVRVNGVEVSRKAALATRNQIGYADSLETQVAPGAVRLEVAVPNRGTSASQFVSVLDRTYVGVSLDPGGQPTLHVSTEPFRYA
jgi:hypothetical protein